MSSNDLQFSEDDNFTVELHEAAASGTVTQLVGAPGSRDLQDNGIMVDSGGLRWFIPWQNVKSIRQALPS